MTTRQLVAILRRRGCEIVRQVGSHQRWRCGRCETTVAIHGGDIPPGTLRAIERQLERCLGKGWMR